MFFLCNSIQIKRFEFSMCMCYLLQKYAGASVYPAKFTLAFMIQANEDQSRGYVTCEYYKVSEFVFSLLKCVGFYSPRRKKKDQFLFSFCI